MTSLAAWAGIDSRGLSTLYIVSDSRLSWYGSSRRWDFAAKVYACPSTPDVFGFYGDVLVPAMVLPRLVEEPLLAAMSTAESRHDLVHRMVKSSADALPSERRGTFGILHASREGDGMSSRRLLWHMQWNPKDAWSDAEIPMNQESALSISLGSGELVVCNDTTAARSELGTVSRSVFTGFCDALASGQDPSSGGVPQLVGLYRHGFGRHFGVIFTSVDAQCGHRISSPVFSSRISP